MPRGTKAAGLTTTRDEETTMTQPSTYLEDLVAGLLAKLKRSGFWDSGIAEAQYLHCHKGYAWDVALSISCEYWCR